MKQGSQAVRGVRGAVVAEEDHPQAISRATKALLEAVMAANPTLNPDDLASVFFTVTADLSSAYPAKAARDLPGWNQVPLLCNQEISVPEGLARCIRVLLHWNTTLPQKAVHHVYLGEAIRLRPDWNASEGRQEESIPHFLPEEEKERRP
jgi:chorismate mutase